MQPSHVPALTMPRGARSIVEDLVAAYQKLSPLDLQAVQVQLQVSTLTTSKLTDTNDYKIPSQYDFVAVQLDGYIRFAAFNSEPVGTSAPLGYNYLTPSERALLKTMNCVVGLQNTDKKHTIGENNDMVLASLIAPPCGIGGPKIWPKEAPILIPAANTLRATFTLQDSTTAIVGASTVYGVTLTGILIPKISDNK